MKKRFTDADKWHDYWFNELSNDDKLLWVFLLDNCDCAGVWQEQFKLFQFYTGLVITHESITKSFGDRIMLVSPRTYLIKKFITFQYGTLRPDKNGAHRGAVKSLIKAGVTFDDEIMQMIDLPEGCSINEALLMPLGRPTGIRIGLGTGIGLGLSSKGKKTITTNEVPF